MYKINKELIFSNPWLERRHDCTQLSMMNYLIILYPHEECIIISQVNKKRISKKEFNELLKDNGNLGYMQGQILNFLQKELNERHGSV
jgi:hypothetical protein